MGSLSPRWNAGREWHTHLARDFEGFPPIAFSDRSDGHPVLSLAVRDVLDFAVIRDGSNRLT
jgi:hypothetical protein